MQRTLAIWKEDPSTRPDWKAAQRAFRGAVKVVERMRQERAAAAARMDRAGELAIEVSRAEQVRNDCTGHLESAVVEVTHAATKHEYAHRAWVELDRTRGHHVLAKPGTWESLLSWGRAPRVWRKMLLELNANVSDAHRELNLAQVDFEQCQQRESSARAQVDRAERRRHELTCEAAANDDALHADAARYGNTYPDKAWLHDEHRREACAPWQDPAFNEARSRLMLCALDLHRAWLANASDIEATMRAAMEVITGSAPRTLRTETRLAAWQAFFLVVPLVSPTFASIGRMFDRLGREALGWLLIDEAGQAAPPPAVGAMWRARRVLVVGDPLQLQPVVTIPRRAQQAMALHMRVHDTWVPSTTSVQALTDRVAKFGTELVSGEETVWVSAPLRVHRRCDTPMFEISNQIAYDGLMLSAVNRDTRDFTATRPSSWIDIPSTAPGTHLQPLELDLVENELRLLASQGVDASKVIAISPFRAVAQALERLQERWDGLQGGTIHTAQGRQAPVVFLVLGGDPSKPGALRWASETPNLLNVAGSRAQHRLYVVGDKQRWARLPYFSTAAQQLDIHSKQQ